MELKPVNLGDLEVNASNVYEAVVAVAKKAREINAENKQEYNALLNAISPGIEDDFEDRENPDQLRISLEFESKPKPHLRSLDELIRGELNFRYKEIEPTEEI